MSEEEKADGLCWLSLDYRTDGKTQEVDYGSRAARLAYLLRYFFAYSREYCMMYRDVLNLMSPRDELTVCSLGWRCADRPLVRPEGTQPRRP